MNPRRHDRHPDAGDTFSSSVAGLPNAVGTEVLDLADGILLDITNPGLWMAHCHIAEHHESGMMFSFSVAPSDAT